MNAWAQLDLPRFACGHVKSPENTRFHLTKSSKDAKAYVVRRCRQCHNERCRQYQRDRYARRAA